MDKLYAMIGALYTENVTLRQMLQDLQNKVKEANEAKVVKPKMVKQPGVEEAEVVE